MPADPHPTDFRQLARRFASAESDADAHLLFNAVFGLQPARHAHLAHGDEELIPSTESWHEAPPVKVPPRLRRTDKEYPGTIGKVRDVKRPTEEHRQKQQLTTDQPIRISRLTELDDEAFRQLLDLIGRALASPPDHTGTRAARNGRVEITLRDARGVTTIQTPSGAFTAPDFLIDVRSAP